MASQVIEVNEAIAAGAKPDITVQQIETIGMGRVIL